MTVKCTRSITYFKAYLKNGKLRAQIFRFSVLQLVQLCHGLNSWSMMSVRPIFSQTRGFWGLWQNTIIVKQTSNERVTKLVYFGNWIGPYWNDLTRFWKDFEILERFWMNFKKRIFNFLATKDHKEYWIILIPDYFPLFWYFSQLK